jgi:hypothetical protein
MEDSFAFFIERKLNHKYIVAHILPDGTPVFINNSGNDCSNNTTEGYDIDDTNYGGRTKGINRLPL